MINEWIRRKRNSHGYGVQSPNDFHFVQHVLREKSAYYAYAELHKSIDALPPHLPHYPEHIYRLLFRLANHAKPKTMIEVGTGAGLSAQALAMARPSGQCITIASPNEHSKEVATILAHHPQVTTLIGDEMALFEQVLQEIGTIELLHIGHTSHYSEVVERALCHVNDNSLFVIEGLRDSAEKQAWWRSLQNNHNTGVSYDTGSVGILFFDKTRYKHNYWVSLRKHKR